MADYQFGCVASSHADWLVQNASVSGSAQEALALDEKGEPVVAHYYQNVAECSFEVIVPTGVTPPEVGEIVKYNSKAWYVASASTTETNTDFVRYSLSLRRFTKAASGTGLPALADASESI